MSEKQKLPYGLWPSPVTPALTSQRMRLQDLQWDTDGQTLVWLEGRSARGVLVASNFQEADRDLTATHNVRARVGYGGGDFTVSHGQVFYAHFKDGRLYQQALQYGSPRPITPGFGSAASVQIDAAGKRALFVHSTEGNDSLGLVDLQQSGWPIQLAKGADFYMSPVWHPSGQQIAWLEWDHPNMPWDGTRLMLGSFAGHGQSLESTLQIAGDGETSIFQPAFSPDGRYLSYITAHGERDALALYDLHTKETTLLVKDVILSSPAWIQGMRNYGWHPNSEQIFYRTTDKGQARLWSLALQAKQPSMLDMLPYTWFEQITVNPVDGRVACLASSASVPTRVICWDDGRKQIVRRSMPEVLHPDFHATPRAISWQAPDQTVVHGLYSPPTNPKCWDDQRPPAIVQIHGGPTAQAVMTYTLDTTFFTSRGFGVLDVNYRGSTGYGKSYRNALRGNWGVFDVEDAVGAAQALAQQGLADPARLVLKGGSAGGYTVLNTFVQHPGVFKAGISNFGIGNLFSLAAATHKFEARYLDSLIGPLPEDGAKYRARSPLFHAQKIRDPLAIFQGAEDQVVPPEQAQMIVSALKANGVAHVYHLYEGEGHGWRKTETIEAYYQSVLQFLQQFVLFA